MRLRKKEQFNLPVRVVGKVKQGDKVGIKAENLLNGETVEVYLSQTGKYAENGKRRGIEEMFKGFETANGQVKIKKGSILTMDGANHQGENVYIAQWPNVISQNGDDEIKFCEKGAFITSEKDGRTSAEFYAFKESQCITTDSINDDLKNALVQSAEKNLRPAYIVRAVDKKNKRVMDYEVAQNFYDSNTQSEMTADQIAGNVFMAAKELLSRYPGKALSILPADRFYIPAKSYEKREAYYNNLKRFFEQKGDDGDVEYLARKALVKCGGQSSQFCNEICMIEPFKPGTDPVLIGGYSHPQKKNAENLGCRP